MSLFKQISLAVLSGLLLGAAWLPGFTWIIFIAFIPFFILTENIKKSSYKNKKTRIFLLTYLGLFIWNISDTWWIWYASEGGAVAAIVANTLLMAFTYLVFYTLSVFMEKKIAWSGCWMILPVWLSFEYIHNNWELAWTWLNLGNVFAFEPNWVQWYEFTGVSGGSLWILSINILLFQLIRFPAGITKLGIALRFVCILLPIAFSQYLLHVYESKKDSKLLTQEVLIVQPNIDPYNDKFNGDFQGQLQKVYHKVKNKITQKTHYLVLPETFLTESMWENDIENSFSIRFLKDSLLSQFPDLNIIVGASTFYRYGKQEKLSETARAIDNTDVYYDVYNTAIQLNKTSLQFYHKSKLVPGVERMPYPALFKPLEGLAINLGGTFGSLGTQAERSVFLNPDKTIGVAPVVCYESIFGEFVTDYVKKGANLIFIITNDGWWRDTPGYKHHLAYARLRAIETRMQIARSANTGISCVIDETGGVHAPQGWWKEGYIVAKVKPNFTQTLYVKWGDVLSKLALITCTILILVCLSVGIQKRA